MTGSQDNLCGLDAKGKLRDSLTWLKLRQAQEDRLQ